MSQSIGSLAPSLRGRMLVVAAVPFAIGVGVAVVLGPPGIAAVAVLLSGVGLLLAGGRIPTVFQVTLAVLLLGYLFLGRGFAYIGFGYAYIGEVAVVLAVAASFTAIGRWRMGFAEVVLLAFIGWGAIRTIPYLGAHGPAALRDAVSWGYALIAVGVAVTLTAPVMARAVALYRRIALAAVVWFPLAAVLTLVLGDQIPAVPGSSVPVVFFKGGDAGVHLAGIGAFVLVGLYRGETIREALLWAAWGVSAVLVAALNRGGMVAASMSVLALLFVRRLSHWLILAAVAVILFASASIIEPRIDLGVSRTVSFQQLVDNVASIFTDRPNTTEQGTKEWRIQWWSAIANYTIGGPYFWVGKGYGVNLADSDGFQVNADRSLRGPHSAHFEFLARSGVPGLALWVLLQVAWAARVLAAAMRARRTDRPWWLAVLAWLFVYWLAALVNMSVDVYLGGPQGGIWFWAVFGAGLAVARLVSDGEPDPPDTATVPAAGPGVRSGAAGGGESR